MIRLPTFWPLSVASTYLLTAFLALVSVTGHALPEAALLLHGALFVKRGPADLTQAFTAGKFTPIQPEDDHGICTRLCEVFHLHFQVLT